MVKMQTNDLKMSKNFWVSHHHRGIKVNLFFEVVRRGCFYCHSNLENVILCTLIEIQYQWPKMKVLNSYGSGYVSICFRHNIYHS